MKLNPNDPLIFTLNQTPCLIYCSSCGHGNPGNAKFCLECGESLTKEKDPDCPACNTGYLTESVHKGVLGIGDRVIYTCSHCGAVFEGKGDKYKLKHIRDLNNPIGQKYKNKPLNFEEWTRIANGGVSDEKQKRIDRERKQREIQEVKQGKTDVMPDGNDKELLYKWTTKKDAPSLSDSFKNLRSIRILPIDEGSLEDSLKAFDDVIYDVENNIIREVDGQVIQSSWKTNPEKKTCKACDYKTFCKDSSIKKKIVVP